MATRPTVKFDWFIPIDGDGEHIGTRRAERPPTFEYLRQVVTTAEALGYYSLLIPTRFANGLFEESAPLAETWTTATALLAATERIRILIAVRPGFISPGLFAQMAATLDELSCGRADINVVPGGIAGDFERLGEQSGHAERYERAEEFIAACRALWSKPEPIDFEGKFVKLRGAMVAPSPSPGGLKMYLGGASDSALALAGRQADVYLAWIQPLEATAALFERTRRHYAAAGRPAMFGLRTHLVVRDSEAEAWRASDELLSRADNAVKGQRQAVFAGTPMVGQQAQLRSYADHRMGERLWNGISTVRVNCGTAIVGAPEQVADELLDYWKLGIDEFILSGYPHVEECRRIASDVLPLLRQKIERENQGA